MPIAPTISILTTTWNRAATYLPQALASVRALRLSVPYEHVVVDDASDDGTAAYLAREAAADPRLRVVRHATRRGVAAARNSAARAARGDFLVDLDDDDLLVATGVERRYRYLLANPARWAVHANALVIDEDGRYLVGQDVVNFACPDPTACARHFYDSTMIPNASTAMYRREALLALGGWDESLSCCEDFDLWLRSLDRYGPPGFLDAVVALYRRKEHSLGIDSVRSGAHARNQRTVKARWAYLVAPPDQAAGETGGEAAPPPG
ncbi:MAG TPA: glycosyltransferase [Thermomicrobiales bacterium]|nr:glycosyltransferase [Thermomicrobiales bacterium]